MSMSPDQKCRSRVDNRNNSKSKAQSSLLRDQFQFDPAGVTVRHSAVVLSQRSVCYHQTFNCRLISTVSAATQQIQGPFAKVWSAQLVCGCAAAQFFKEHVTPLQQHHKQ